ncbi:MAG: type I restriction-modification system subunit M [Nitrosotalea sp.]
MNESNVITIQILEKYLWDSAVILRNKMDAGDYKIYIFPLLFYKRLCDVYDEEYKKALEESKGDKKYASSDIIHNFQIPKGAHWNDLRNISNDVGAQLQRNLRMIEKENPERLFGIFGDVDWTNKDVLSDETLKNLIEHFSTLNLSTTSVPNDLMGTGYEFLIKQFADDSGHTAAEFYTTRTVVTLMTKITSPKENESIYDPTCGSGGMLLEAVNQVKRSGNDFRSLRLYGQEKNVMTSGIARMNVLLHGFQDAEIKRGDTLSEPLFLKKNGSLKKFDVILANPPYSISKWDHLAWTHDAFGRNILGLPPKSRADYAFIQHILASLSEKGRAAILLPHGVLFRNAEDKLRKNLVESDKLEAVIGLGPNLFYNSPMESCIIILRYKKPKEKQQKILFVNAIDLIEKAGNRNKLSEEQIDIVFREYQNFKNNKGRSYVATNDEIEKKKFLLSIPLYVKIKSEKILPVGQAFSNWLESSNTVNSSISKILEDLEVIVK